MTIIDGYIALFIFAMAIVVMTCDPDKLSDRNIERVCTMALTVIGMIIVAGLIYLMTL
jgi:hypothetical protein